MFFSSISSPFSFLPLSFPSLPYFFFLTFFFCLFLSNPFLCQLWQPMISNGKSAASIPPPQTLMAALESLPCPSLHHLIWDAEGAEKTDGWHRGWWFTAWNPGETSLKSVREEQAWHLTETSQNEKFQTKVSSIRLLFSRCTNHRLLIWQLYWEHSIPLSQTCPISFEQKSPITDI